MIRQKNQFVVTLLKKIAESLKTIQSMGSVSPEQEQNSLQSNTKPLLTFCLTQLRIQNRDMQPEIISEQIPVCVIGTRKFDFLSILLDLQLDIEEVSHDKYARTLNQVLKKPGMITQRGQSCTKNQLAGISCFSKCLSTKHFWLNYTFFVHSNTVFDCFASDLAKGPVSICIVANDERDEDLTELRTYIQNPQYRRQQQSDTAITKKIPKNSRGELLIESSLYHKMHNANQLKAFESVLWVKLSAGSKIIEESSNLKLSVNQINRWITERHFESRYRLKLRQDLGDQIQYHQDEPKKSACLMM